MSLLSDDFLLLNTSPAVLASTSRTSNPLPPVAPGPSAAVSASTTPQQAAQFQIGTLARHALAADPLAQFHAWFRAAQDAGVYVPETCCLATASLPSGAR